MIRILFITSNKAKFEWAERRLRKFGIQVEQHPLDIPEPREFEIETVAIAKAISAMKQVKSPFIVEDSGFQVRALSNFPGSYMKLVQETIGAKGICSLMKGKKDRLVHFKSVLTYADKNRKIHLFTWDDVGKIPDTPKGNNLKGWSEFMQIFIPKGYKKTLAELDRKEFSEYERLTEIHDHYVKFAQWTLKNEQ